MSDPQLAYDAAQMRSLLDTPMWEVLKRRLEGMQTIALTRVMHPSATDPDTHHWRGVYTALADAIEHPRFVIEYERAMREAA